MLYELEIVSLRKTQEANLEVAEVKMLRFTLGVAKLDRIRNEYIRGTVHIRERVKEARLRWFGHMRRDQGYVSKRMTRLELPVKWPRGRPKRRYMDVKLWKEDAEDF